jgi:hypothetical protein
MKYISYVSAGIERDPTSNDQLFGGFEVFLYNPTWEPCDTRMTIYFEDREPFVLPEPIHIPPKWSFLQTSRNTVPDVLHNVGFWGAKYESNVPLIPILIFGTGGFGGEGRDASLTGGVTHFLGTDLHTLWYFPNGIWRTCSAPVDTTNPLLPPPFSEFEVYYFLNPGEHDAEVTMVLQYRELEHATLRFRVPAQRLFTWSNYGKVPENQPYGVKVAATAPITTCATRYLYDPAGPAAKGIFVRAGMAAVPGPITE